MKKKEKKRKNKEEKEEGRGVYDEFTGVIKQARGRKLIKDIQMDTPISKDILELES